MADKVNPRAARLKAIGNQFAGERWQSALARATGVSQSYLNMIVNGDRQVTDEVERRIATGLLNEADRLRKAADKIDDIVGRILHRLEK